VPARVTHGCSFVDLMRSVIAGFAFMVAAFELPVAFCVFCGAVAWAADGAWFVMSNRVSHNLRRFLSGFVGMMSAPSSVSASKCSSAWCLQNVNVPPLGSATTTRARATEHWSHSIAPSLLEDRE